MGCDIFKTYGGGVPGQFSAGGRTRFVIFSEQWFDDWPRQLMVGGMTCQQARDYIRANWQFVNDGVNPPYPRVIVTAGSFFGLCSALNGAGTGGTFNTRDIELNNLTEIGGVSYPAACTPSAAYKADGTWGELYFESFVSSATTWLPSLFTMNTVDVDKWFCCRTSCCGTANTSSAPHFTFPADPLPDPVEEKATTPILKTPLYLSNHTWQYVRNFGRLNK